MLNLKRVVFYPRGENEPFGAAISGKDGRIYSLDGSIRQELGKKIAKYATNLESATFFMEDSKISSPEQLHETILQVLEAYQKEKHRMGNYPFGPIDWRDWVLDESGCLTKRESKIKISKNDLKRMKMC